MSDLSKYLELSDIDPESDDIVLTKDRVTEAYKKIYQYHCGVDEGVIHPQKCILNGPDNSRREIPTIAGTMNLNSFEIDNYIGMGGYVSNYDKRIMSDTLGVDLESTWNDTLAGVRYDANGNLRYFRSDFYTQISFSRILLLEAIKNSINNESKMSFREHYLNKSDMLLGDTDEICTGSSAGAIIIGENYASDTVLLIGKRSNKPSVNKNRYSIAPNSTVKYDDLRKRGLEETVEQGVVDELMGYTGGMEKFADSVDVRDPYIGWNLRDCSMFAVYYLIIKNSSVYESLKDSMRQNREFQKMVEIPIKDYESISSLFNINNASPENIPAVARAVRLAARDDEMEDIDYSINTRTMI